MQLNNFDTAAFLRDYWQKRPLLIRNPWQSWLNPLSPDELGGLWEAWEDKLRRTQLEMFANELHDPKMRPYAMGAVRRLIETTGVTDGIFEPGTDLRLELAEGSWLGDLVAWAVQKHMRLELPKVGTTAPWEWDLNVKEHL